MRKLSANKANPNKPLQLFVQGEGVVVEWPSNIKNAINLHDYSSQTLLSWFTVFGKQTKYKEKKIRASEFRNFVKFQAKTS